MLLTSTSKNFLEASRKINSITNLKVKQPKLKQTLKRVAFFKTQCKTLNRSVCACM